jgi:serine/threonine-protein kinase
MDTGRFEEAVGEFRRALEIDPGAVDAHIKLGATYYDLGKPQEAEESYQKAVNLRPGYWLGYNGLGSFYSRRGRYEEAVPLFRTVISLAPDNLLAHQNLGGVYLKMGRYDEAIAILKKSIELKPTGVACSNLASAYVYQGRYREAVPVMEEAVRLLPTHHMLWRNLGDAYQWSGQPAKAPPAYKQALKVAQDVLAVSPQDPQTLSSLALYWAKLGQKQNARAHLAQALKLAPLDNEVIFKSALIFELTGDRNRAIAAIKAAWKGGYSLVQIEKQPELAPLRSDQRYRQWRQEIGKHN